MNSKTYRYADPTGGGDDALLTLPEWADYPLDIRVRDVNGEAYYFEFDSEEDED